MRRTHAIKALLLILPSTLGAQAPAPAGPPSSNDVQVIGDFPVIEFRRYAIKPGEREHFARYFESYFPEAFEQLGSVAAGSFFDRGTHTGFTWIRGYHTIEARAEWEDFPGTSVMWLTLDGLGTIDDNVLELPGGTYRAVGIRAFDAKTGQWSIWWLDGRFPDRIDVPVRGGFKDGVGTFVGDDTLNGRPIKMRFRWSGITATSAHWEQAFSPDGGVTWETNWTMEFTRAK